MTFSVELTTMTCSCGIVYAVPEPWRKEKAADHSTWRCPNGCSRHYPAPSESVEQRLIREKVESERRLQAKLNESEHARLVAEKATKKAIADKRKVERRIAHGVCPCCNKVFTDLSHHMIENHKDFRLPGGKAQKQLGSGALSA